MAEELNFCRTGTTRFVNGMSNGMIDSIPRLSRMQIREWFANLPKQDFAGRRILLIIPKLAGPGPISSIFEALFDEIRPVCLALDVLVALGAESPLSDSQISGILGIDETERRRLFFQTQFFNHEWDRPDRLVTIGILKNDTTAQLTQGLLSHEISVQINSRTRDYDLLLVLCPVSPEPFVGYSGGNVCFFPGLAGPEILDMITHLKTIVVAETSVGLMDTAVRRLADAASAMIPQQRRAITFVTAADGRLCGLIYDTPETAWNAAAALSARCHEINAD